MRPGFLGEDLIARDSQALIDAGLGQRTLAAQSTASRALHLAPLDGASSS